MTQIAYAEPKCAVNLYPGITTDLSRVGDSLRDGIRHWDETDTADANAAAFAVGYMGAILQSAANQVGAILRKVNGAEAERLADAMLADRDAWMLAAAEVRPCETSREEEDSARTDAQSCGWAEGYRKQPVGEEQ